MAGKRRRGGRVMVRVTMSDYDDEMKRVSEANMRVWMLANGGADPASASPVDVGCAYEQSERFRTQYHVDGTPRTTPAPSYAPPPSRSAYPSASPPPRAAWNPIPIHDPNTYDPKSVPREVPASPPVRESVKPRVQSPRERALRAAADGFAALAKSSKAPAPPKAPAPRKPPGDMFEHLFDPSVPWDNTSVPKDTSVPRKEPRGPTHLGLLVILAGTGLLATIGYFLSR